ncbi:unnamed protein product [Cyprideis torosa]|uniref:hypoxanthine phosphoribosyltransferase n=1 Tax=Cyprideis torosa TaxID=163714 RepID=A0A7R8WC63_9CRUS|nr:unnamed protein product [Cyprideis torosa]CAG0888109.1 unnamed protein product [Cyprideis torosa]
MFCCRPMRTKNFILLLVCVITGVIVVILSNSREATLEGFVYQTHKQLDSLKNFKDNIRDAFEQKFTAEQSVLESLGFVPNPRLYPKDVWTNITTPPIVTGAFSGQFKVASGFIKNVHHYLPDRFIILYDLGFSTYQLDELSKSCNSSNSLSTRCMIQPFDYSSYPSHVSRLRNHAYRPLIIQEVLNAVGSIIWLDVDTRLAKENIDEFLTECERSGGLMAWVRDTMPTSALTHPNMFEVMFPWIQCALTDDCISPIGAQATGCRFDKIPKFRYSNCHRYDASALNIVLGKAFSFNSSLYMYRETFFRKQGEDWEYDDDNDSPEEDEEGLVVSGVEDNRKDPRRKNDQEKPKREQSFNMGKCVNIPDNFAGYPLDSFCVPKHYEDDLDRIMLPYGLIRDRVERLASDIFEDLGGQPLTAICVLTGGFKFFTELMNCFTRLNASADSSVPLDFNFIHLKSYKDEKSTGNVEIQGFDVFERVRGRNVLVVEDIVDTGLTMKSLLKQLEAAQPKTIKVVSLLVKRAKFSSGYRPDYIGFEIPDCFVVGYALDYNEHFRDLNHLAVINLNGRKKYASHARDDGGKGEAA